MSESAKHKDIESLSFEEALQELDQIVRKLEEGGQQLDNAIEYYSRGTALRKHCEKRLTEAKLKVEKIIAKDGVLHTENFEQEGE